MNFLMFLISVIFSFVFYFFYLISNNKNIFWYDFSSPAYFDSLSWNLVWESVLFIILGVVFYIYFSDFSIKNDEKLLEEDIDDILEWDIWNNIERYINKEKILNKLSIFFKNYLYYIWFIFLYFGIYLIYKSYSLDTFSYIILLLNIIILALFFITKKFFIFRDSIKINVILFSIYYLVFYINNFLNSITIFPLVDIINSFLLLFSFLLVFYNDSKILNYKKLDNSLLIYFFLYIFIFLWFTIWCFLNNFLYDFKISFILAIVATLLNISIYFWFLKIKFFKNNLVILRVVSFVFWYIVSIIWIIYFLRYGFNILLFISLIYFIVFNFIIHNKYENYISFFFSNSIIVFLIYFFYYKIFYTIDDGIIFLILSLVLSLEWIIITYFYDFKYNFDYYFFHLFSYATNFISIIFYLIVFKIDLFTLWIIFFIESFYIFLSYYRLKQIKNLK